MNAWFSANAKGVLVFHMTRPPSHCANGVHFEFEGDAEAQHVKSYSSQLSQFLGSDKKLLSVGSHFLVVTSESTRTAIEPVKEVEAPVVEERSHAKKHKKH